LDLAVPPSGTVFCLVLLAAWFVATATDRLEGIVGSVLIVVLGITSLASLDAVYDGDDGFLTRADGGVARALALGGLLMTVGLLRARHTFAQPQPRDRLAQRGIGRPQGRTADPTGS
jgi:hypothetical protein